MNRPAVLLVSKLAFIDRIRAVELASLVRNRAVDRARLEDSRREHLTSLDQVLAALHGCRVRRRLLHRLVPADSADVDLVVTVGGDGTVLAVHAQLTNTPIIAVNSDPRYSIGHYTRCRATEVGDLLAAWRAGTSSIQSFPRLELALTAVCDRGRPLRTRILNDCLFTNRCPAAMTRYRLSADDMSEDQSSSGVWISTPSGSTGAIASAGMMPVPADQPALLFKVREPFFGHYRFTALAAVQAPPRGLVLTPTIPGIACFIDGNPHGIDVPPGHQARIGTCRHPLRLVAPMGSMADTQAPRHKEDQGTLGLGIRRIVSTAHRIVLGSS